MRGLKIIVILYFDLSFLLHILSIPDLCMYIFFLRDGGEW